MSVTLVTLVNLETEHVATTITLVRFAIDTMVNYGETDIIVGI